MTALKKQQISKTTWAFIAILAVGIFLRVWKFGQVPNGMNQDEALAAYNAWSMLKTGVDEYGYHNPVYFIAWGDGMNVLESYLMMPFIALLGMTPVTARLPQLIIAILSMPTIYGVIRRTAGTKPALFGMAFLATSPWHYMLSRWGLESNLAPGLLLFGLYFFILGLENHAYFIPSALMYGLSLYAYAAIWPAVPVMLLLQAAYAIWIGKISKTSIKGRNAAYLAISTIILATMATPLILFLAVNYGLIDEIRLSWISIPKLIVMRSDMQDAFKPARLFTLMGIVATQYDDRPWNNTRSGIPIHLFAILTAVIGIMSKKSAKKKHPADTGPDTSEILLPQFITALLQGVMMKTNINRINMIWIPILAFAGIGASALHDRLNNRKTAMFAATYALLLALNAGYYFTAYDTGRETYVYRKGLEQAVTEAISKAETVYYMPVMVTDESDGSESMDPADRPCIMFYAQVDPNEYRNTVQFTNYPSNALIPSEFCQFKYGFDPSEPDYEAAYISRRRKDLEPLAEKGFTIHVYNWFGVAYYE